MIYARLNGVEEMKFGDVWDPLASKITITQAQLKDALRQRQLAKTPQGPILFRLESKGADGHHQGQKDVLLTFD